MKKSQIIILLILLLLATLIIWIPACNSCRENNETKPAAETATPSATSEIKLTTPTLPPEPTPSPTPTPTPTPSDVVFPNLKESDFDGLSDKAVTWEAGFSSSDGVTSAWYDKSLDKYVKGLDYVFQKNDSDTVKEIYLTFNISYDKESTVRILDTLKEHNDSSDSKVHVTFFIQSDCLDWTEVIMRIKNEGHLLAIRSFPGSMSNESVKTTEAKLKEIEAKYRLIFGSTERMFYYRPGDTFSTKEIAVANALGYKVVFYCYKYRDWDTEVYNKDGSNGKINAAVAVLDNFHDGSVIMLLASELNADILPEVITQGLGQGFTFERLDE